MIAPSPARRDAPGPRARGPLASAARPHDLLASPAPARAASALGPLASSARARGLRACAAQLLVCAALLACGSEAPKPAPAPAPAPPAEAPPAKAEPFAAPKLAPPPPPEGAALLADRKRAIYVQRCDAGHPCPDLLQPAGETHCRELQLGGFTGWRLPDRDEVKRFGEIADLELAEGFHWTRTAFAEDAAQAWIVDPKSGQETTIPRARKPFRVRCVFEP